MKDIILTASSEDEGKRLDRFAAENQESFTRSALKKVFDEGGVLVNGLPRQRNHKLKMDDKIEIKCSEIARDNADIISVKPKDLPLDIIYEDADLLVVNKPQGIVTHPASPEEENTLVSALLFHLPGKLSTVAGPLRPGIVHRIDKDTSGLLVVAKTDAAHENLASQAEAHTMLRRYEGIVHGNLKQDCGVIDYPVGRHPVHRTKRAVLSSETTGSRHAVTRYRVLGRFNGFCHAEFELETGRTHQIRVHTAHIGHPVAGDPLYGPAKPVKGLSGQCLHARTLGFTHPTNDEWLEFTSALPGHFDEFLKRLILDAED